MSSQNNQGGGGGGDDRFLKVRKDPRFWEMPEKEHKIKIDKRFQSMFHDERFKVKYTVDKRGRPIHHTTKEDLKRFYNLSDSGEEEEEKEDTAKGKKVAEKKKKKKKKGKEKLVGGDKVVVEEPQKRKREAVQSNDGKLGGERPVGAVPVGGKADDGDEEEEEEEEEEQQSIDEEDVDMRGSFKDGSEEGGDDDDEDKDTDADSELESGSNAESGSELSSSEEEEDGDSDPDLARGMGNVETSSDEDEVGVFLRREEEEIEHDWGDLCKDALRNDEVSARLAVCNMDWDRMKARDLLALVNSFKPKVGVVLSVKIYPSEFGKERLVAEETRCPVELLALPDDPDQDTKEERVYREKMRDYQFKRLKYYYAIVECDSRDTAVKIYEECDGFEYESSCSVMDLRFIPDDVTFDDEPKDVATDVDLSAYTPKIFTSHAAALSTVEVTWDETDHDRVTAMSKKFNKDEILQMDFNAYLASSSEEDDGVDGGFVFPEQGEDEETPDAPQAEEAAVEEVKKKPKETKKEKKKKSTEQISKYRDILKSIQDKNKDKDKDKDMEMEITWVPGLKETTEQLVKKKLEGKDKPSPWEQFLEKKTDKKKQKREAQRKQTSAESDPPSDDELPPDVDLNDPFFSEELCATANIKKKGKGKKKQKEEERTPEEEEELEKRKAEMALLMDDDDGSKHQHFNYDKIVEHENLSKKKRKKLLKTNKAVEEEDDFQVDVKDPRFQAVFTSHLYNLDPSDPNYKKTRATQSILAEKQRRREEEEATPTQEVGAKRQEAEDAAAEDASNTKKTMDPGLSMLIKSIKNKTEQFQARKKPRIV